MVDLLLVNTPLQDYGKVPKRSSNTLPVLGLAYIATFAENAGFEVELLDAEAEGMSVLETQAHVNQLQPKWVGLNLLAPTYEVSVQILSGLNEDIYVLLGGHQAKALPEKILEDGRIPRIDALVLGEGETRVAEILRGDLVPDKLPNVLTRRSKSLSLWPRTLKDAAQYLSPNINDLPFVNRKFLPNDPFLASDGRIEANIVGSRGCPFDCSFCGAAISANPDITIRMREIDNILAELTQLHEVHNCTAFRFVDDLFLANPKFLRRAIDGFLTSPLAGKIVWDATGRINVIDKLSEADITKMKMSGCREVALGIESGSDRLLEYIDKKLSREQILRTARKLLRHGINIKGYFILGFPTETEAEFDETLSLIDELWAVSDQEDGQLRCSVFEFRPYPGTPEWNRLVDDYGYTELELLSYAHAEIEAGVQRDQFNFSTELQFGEVSLELVRSSISKIMTNQADRLAKIV